MEVILLKDVEKVGLRGEVVNVARGYARNYLLPRQLAEVGDARRRSPRSSAIDEQRARHEARTRRAGAGDRGDARQDRAALRRQGRPDRVALRLGHADRHRRRDLADAQDPRRPAQDRHRHDQAHRPLHGPDPGLRGRHRRGEDARRARGRRAAARGGARGDGGRRGGSRGRGRGARPSRRRPSVSSASAGAAADDADAAEARGGGRPVAESEDGRGGDRAEADARGTSRRPRPAETEAAAGGSPRPSARGAAPPTARSTGLWSTPCGVRASSALPCAACADCPRSQRGSGRCRSRPVRTYVP